MEEKKKSKFKFITIIGVFTIIVLAIGTGYFIYSNIQQKTEHDKTLKLLESKINSLSEKNNTTEIQLSKLQAKYDQLVNNKTPDTITITKGQALEIAEGVYSKAYDAVAEGSGFTNVKTKTEIFNKYFTLKAQKYIEKMNVTGQGNADYEYFISTIFGITDQGKRPLTILCFDENLIIATGKLLNSENYEGDKYPLYIMFNKINGVWLIDKFE